MRNINPDHEAIERKFTHDKNGTPIYVGDTVTRDGYGSAKVTAAYTVVGYNNFRWDEVEVEGHRDSWTSADITFKSKRK